MMRGYGADVQVWVGISGDSEFKVTVFRNEAELATEDFELSASERGLVKLRDAADQALAEMSARNAKAAENA